MRRKFVITLDVIDHATPTKDTETSAKALKDYIIDSLCDISFDVNKIEVSCENI